MLNELLIKYFTYYTKFNANIKLMLRFCLIILLNQVFQFSLRKNVA